MAGWREFIEDNDGRGSAARLNMLIGVIVGSFCVVWLTTKGNLGGEIFATFMLATGGVYAWGKTRESIERVEQTKADSPNQPPTTIINTGNQPKESDNAAV